jgi:hypothetical protein
MQLFYGLLTKFQEVKRSRLVLLFHRKLDFSQVAEISGSGP